MPHRIRRSVRFTLHFEAEPLQLLPDCLSEHTASVDELELLCDGKLLQTYSRSQGSVTREYLCDTAFHEFTLRTCGTVRLANSVLMPEGNETCLLEARESERFRLNIAEMTPPPPYLDIMAYDTTYAVAEDLIEVLPEWEDELNDNRSLLISFGEEAFGIYVESDTLQRTEGYIADYAALEFDHPTAKYYTRLCVPNRKHLQRYVYGYLRGCPELQQLRFEWLDTVIRVTAARPPLPNLQKLCHEIYCGRIGHLLDDASVRCARLYPEPSSFVIHCYNNLLPNSTPMAGKSLRFKLHKKDADAFGSPERFRKELAAALQQYEHTEGGTNIHTLECSDHILLTPIEDPYFTFD